MVIKKQRGNTPGERVQLDKLKPGMLMAEDLRDFNGRLILQKGTPLDLKSLRLIRMWGITEAWVELNGSGIEADSLLEDEIWAVDETAREEAKEFFRFSNRKHEVMQNLEQLFLQRYPVGRETGESVKPTEGERVAIEPMDIRQQLEEEIHLPSLPTIVVRLNEALNHPSCTATHIADIIAKDSSLTARLLRLVNSGLYNFPTAIESIPRAVTIIGSRQLSELAMASAVVTTFKEIPSELVDMSTFWKHSVASGIICRLLAGYRKNTNTESFFLAGLLHDIGRLILFLYFPVQAKELLLQSLEKPSVLHILEKEYLGIDHAELGCMLIKRWQLPRILELSCRFHHDPLKAPQKSVAAMVHVADLISNSMRMGSSGEYYVPALVPEAWDELGLSSSVIAPVVQQTERILEESVQTYLSE